MKKTIFPPKLAFVVAAMLAAQSISAQHITIIDLGTLGGGLGGLNSRATAMNNHGHVVGVSEATALREEHAFLWTRELGMLDLGTLGVQKFSISKAAAINTMSEIAARGSISDNQSNQSLNHQERTKMSIAICVQ